MTTTGPMIRSTTELEVEPHEGFTIDDFMAHHAKLKNKHATLNGEIVDKPGVFRVTVVYTAVGATRTDVLKTYLVPKKWQHFNIVYTGGRRVRV